MITLVFPRFYIVNAYIPNAGWGLPRLDYKLKFNEIFLKYCEGLRKQKSLVIRGET